MQKPLVLISAFLLLLNIGQALGLFKQRGYFKKMPVVVPSVELKKPEPALELPWGVVLNTLRQLNEREDLKLSQAQKRTLLPLLRKAWQTRQELRRHKNSIHHLNEALVNLEVKLVQVLSQAQFDYIINNRDLIELKIKEKPLWEELLKDLAGS
jgi:hypothetical protein